jgi:hypothetical protein
MRTCDGLLYVMRPFHQKPLRSCAHMTVRAARTTEMKPADQDVRDELTRRNGKPTKTEMMMNWKLPNAVPSTFE